MSRLDDLIRDALAAHAADAPGPERLITSLHTEQSASRRKRWHVALIAATNIALVVGVIAFALTRDGAPRPLSPAADATRPAIPARMQPVSFHGMQVFVPASWRLNDTRCGTPLSDTAIIEIGFVDTCLVPQSAGLTVVRFTTKDSEAGKQRSEVATDPVTIDGHSGRRGRGVPPGGEQPISVLIVDDPGVVISVESPDSGSADQILESAAVVTVDSYGCAAHVESLIAPKAHGAPADEMVPGSPSSTTICFYTDNWLGRSVLLSEEHANALRQKLNTLPEGVSYPVGFTESPAECQADARRGYIVHARYTSRDPVDVYIHIGGCDGLSASNGSRTTKIDAGLAGMLTVAGYDGALSNLNQLR